MATPATKRKTVNLSRLAELNRNLRQAIEDEKKIVAYKKALIKQVQAEMKKKDAEVAEIDGIEVFTWAKTDGFAWAKFVEEHPQIAGQCMKHEWVEVLDKDKVKAEHSGILEEFRTRTFLVK